MGQPPPIIQQLSFVTERLQACRSSLMLALTVAQEDLVIGQFSTLPPYMVALIQWSIS